MRNRDIFLSTPFHRNVLWAFSSFLRVFLRSRPPPRLPFIRRNNSVRSFCFRSSKRQANSPSETLARLLACHEHFHLQRTSTKSKYFLNEDSGILITDLNSKSLIGWDNRNFLGSNAVRRVLFQDRDGRPTKEKYSRTIFEILITDSNCLNVRRFRVGWDSEKFLHWKAVYGELFRDWERHRTLVEEDWDLAYWSQLSEPRQI